MRDKYIVKSNLILAMIGGSVFIGDQLTKWVARQYGWAQLNQGGIWGLFPSWNWTLMSLIVLVFLLIYGLTHYRDNYLAQIGWVIIFSSGLANTYDRLLDKGVWDWIYYPILNVVGNLADILLGVGLILVIVAHYYHQNQPEVK